MFGLNKYERNKLIRWIFSRQTRKGGFSFSDFLPNVSSMTFYAVSTLNLMQAKIQNKNKIIDYLFSLQSSNGKYDNIYSEYYVVKTLSIFGIKPKVLSGAIKSVLYHLERWKKIRKHYFQIVSPLETIFYSVEILKMLNNKDILSRIPEIILRFYNKDGGFGVNKHSEIVSTYFALASLDLSEYPIKNPKKTLAFLRRCENSNYGFSSVPNTYSNFIEDSYFGVKCLDILGEKIKHPKQTVDFILRCQNSDGGFNRSESIGASFLENCFYAVHILDSISKYK